MVNFTFVLVFQVDVDDLVDEPLSGELEVVALHGHQVEAARLVQGLQPDPVLGVDGGLLGWSSPIWTLKLVACT